MLQHRLVPPKTTGIRHLGDQVPIQRPLNPLLLRDLVATTIGEQRLTLGPPPLREGQLRPLAKEMIGEALAVTAVPGPLVLMPLQEEVAPLEANVL